MVVELMQIIPPRNSASILLQPKAEPTRKPRMIIPKMMVSVAMMAGPPTFTIFLKLNSSPRAKSRKMTPISDHTWMLAASITDGVRGKWGLAIKPATRYPSTRGCFNFLKTSVIMPAEMRISARSAMSGASSFIYLA